MVANRTPLMAGNWKMNMTHLQAIAFVQKLAWTLKDAKHDFSRVEVAVFPPFTGLRAVQTLVTGDRLDLAYGAGRLSADTADRLVAGMAESLEALVDAAAGPASERGSAPGGASPRTSTSTTQTHKYGRRIKRPGFEPTQPGKYHLAGTVSLPTLNVARTAEQRARDETGLPETEPALIQSLLAAPSSSTVRARAGIINSIPFVEEAVPPGQVLVAEERKVLVRPVM